MLIHDWLLSHPIFTMVRHGWGADTPLVRAVAVRTVGTTQLCTRGSVPVSRAAEGATASISRPHTPKLSISWLDCLVSKGSLYLRIAAGLALGSGSLIFRAGCLLESSAAPHAQSDTQVAWRNSATLEGEGAPLRQRSPRRAKYDVNNAHTQRKTTGAIGRRLHAATAHLTLLLPTIRRGQNMPTNTHKNTTNAGRLCTEG
jgi:hypothetical protein